MVVIHPKKRVGANMKLKFSTHRIKTFVYPKGAKDPIQCFAFLSDIKKSEVGIYLDRKLGLDDIVLVAFNEKDSQPYRTKVVWNRSINDSNPGGKKGFTWRVGLGYEFASEDEAKRFAAFLSEVRDRVAKTTTKDKEQPVMREGDPDDLIFDDDEDDVA